MLHCLEAPYFIHVPIDGRLGCFQVLAIINKAAVTSTYKRFVDTSFHRLWVKTEEHKCRIVWHRYVYYWKKPPKYFLKWLCHFAFPPTLKNSCCSTCSLGFDVQDLSPSNRWVVVLDFYLICTSLMTLCVMTNYAEHLLTYLFAICLSSLLRCLFESFAYF